VRKQNKIINSLERHSKTFRGVLVNRVLFCSMTSTPNKFQLNVKLLSQTRFSHSHMH